MTALIYQMWLKLVFFSRLAENNDRNQPYLVQSSSMNDERNQPNLEYLRNLYTRIGVNLPGRNQPNLVTKHTSVATLCVPLGSSLPFVWPFAVRYPLCAPLQFAALCVPLCCSLPSVYPFAVRCPACSPWLWLFP